jgi:molybdopterin molybdotransferase
MVSIEEALRLIHEQSMATSATSIAVDKSLGHYLAEPIFASFDLPNFDNSAMDGYAVCGFGAQFEIVGEVAAGNTKINRLEEGQAMRIFTGGKVPTSTTAVIMQEHTSVRENTLTLSEKVIEHKNIRRKGTEIAKDQQVFVAGQKITPASIGVLSSLGKAEVAICKKPNIKIIATGNELVEPGQPLLEGQIYESNTLALTGALEDHGFHVAATSKIKDDLDATISGIEHNLQACDVLLLSGGISVGDYDYVKEALEANGVEEVFYKVFQKPGKPLYFGKRGNQFVFALPGNPASSLTCFYVYVLPLLQRLSGGEGLGLSRVMLPINHEYEIKFDRPVFLKARLENQQIAILDGQGSSMIHSMAKGNILAFVTGPKKFTVGDLVECILI